MLALLNACGTGPRVTASGDVAGYSLHGPVDNVLARDYIEGRPLPLSLQKLRARLLSSPSQPSRELLAWVSREYSPDVATLLFLETLSAQPAARDLRARYEREVALIQRVGIDRAQPAPTSDLLILMIPGWFYVSHGAETNADFRIQRRLYEQWGVAHRLVPIDENGTVANNADIVAHAIRSASAEHRIFLVSASKSGAEVALALGSKLAPQEADRVVGWLSIVGAVRGSPLADRVLEADLCWFARGQLALEGFGLDGLQSMRSSLGRPQFDRLRFPSHIRIFSVIAVPLSGYISPRGSFGYGRMRELGPNDGLTLLTDELIPGAIPLVLPGVDHFLGPEDQRLWSTAIFRVLVAELSREPLPAARGTASP
jgi:hypothetical protein